MLEIKWPHLEEMNGKDLTQEKESRYDKSC